MYAHHSEQKTKQPVPVPRRERPGKAKRASEHELFNVEEISCAQTAKRILQRVGDLLALDCEGNSLRPTTGLTIITLADFHQRKIWLFHKSAWCSELRQVLEDPKKMKFMYDCRTDSAALRFQVKPAINLAGVLDLQLLIVYFLRRSGMNIWRRPGFSAAVKMLHKHHVKVHLPRAAVMQQEIGKEKWLRDMSLWDAPVLDRDLRLYAAWDTQLLFEAGPKLLKAVSAKGLERVLKESVRALEAFDRTHMRSPDDAKVHKF